MTIIRFPPHDSADPSGLLALGGDLEVPSLLLAYSNGIFPWPFDEKILAWFSPPRRAVLFLNKVHVSRSLKKLQRKSPFTFKIDQNFREVITRCATSSTRRDQRGTWITRGIQRAYCELHEAGYAHSFECYEKEKLVGGLYGVSVGRTFAGESMFYTSPNASKLTLLFLCDFLREHSVEWIDCQVMTPLFHSFGAEEVERELFLEMVRREGRNPSPLSPPLPTEGARES